MATITKFPEVYRTHKASAMTLIIKRICNYLIDNDIKFTYNHNELFYVLTIEYKQESLLILRFTETESYYSEVYFNPLFMEQCHTLYEGVNINNYQSIIENFKARIDHVWKKYE
jgi:hypothetical protein